MSELSELHSISAPVPSIRSIVRSTERTTDLGRLAGVSLDEASEELVHDDGQRVTDCRRGVVDNALPHQRRMLLHSQAAVTPSDVHCGNHLSFATNRDTR